MKKFFRNLFSGYFLVLLILLLEIGIIVFIQFFLDDIIANAVGEGNDNLSMIVMLLYLLCKLIAFIVALIIFFRIVNKPEDPEFKIPRI